jgi:hypothetical protein
MAQLWMQDQSSGAEWVVMPLSEGAFALAPGDALPVRPRRAGTDCVGAALLLCSRGPEGEAWLVMGATQAGVRLNGAPLRTGVRVLQDRDELDVDGLGRVFFSEERLVRVEPFPGGERPVFCPRCKQAISAGSASVQCPQCRVWHHQCDDLPCWTYAERCALCDQPTALDAGYRWTPEEL